MREKLARLMVGRNGSDQLNRFISILSFALMIISLFLPASISGFLWAIVIALIMLCYVRMFSRKLDKRREENAKYMAISDEVRAYFRGAKERRAQSREYKFFRCPACRTMLRVPRGKGKIKVVCRKCGNSFIKKS